MPTRRRASSKDVVSGRGQVLWAIKQIVQFVHRTGAKPGDQLPNHQQLAAMISVSNDTLTAAMVKLLESGLVSRRSRAGTIVLDPHAADNLPWTIGLATIPAARLGQASYFAELHFRMQVEIARRGWRSASYFRFKLGGCPELQDFCHLNQDLQSNALDAVLFMTPLRLSEWNLVKSAGVIPYHASFDETLPDTLLLDHPRIIREAMKLLVTRGARRIAIVSGRHPCKPVQSLSQVSQQGIPESFDPKRVEWFDASMLEGGMQLADTILARPASSRPDAWIVLDDFVALGMTSRFDSQGYRPTVAACLNSHNPLRFPWPILQFHVNLPDIVDRLMHNLHQRLLNPQTPQAQEWFAIPLVESTAAAASPATVAGPESSTTSGKNFRPREPRRSLV